MIIEANHWCTKCKEVKKLRLIKTITNHLTKQTFYVFKCPKGHKIKTTYNYTI